MLGELLHIIVDTNTTPQKEREADEGLRRLTAEYLIGDIDLPTYQAKTGKLPKIDLRRLAAGLSR